MWRKYKCFKSMKSRVSANQISLFSDPIIPSSEMDIEPNGNTFFDDTMAKLELLNKMASAQNDLLKSMIDDLQKDWTDEEKLMVNNPKEYYRLQKINSEQHKNNTEMAKELTSEAIQTLKNSVVTGNIVKLPEGQLDRKIYVEVKTRLELIGGKWKGGKVSGFVFDEDPSELLDQIANGEKRNLKKEFQFFATPEALCDRLVKLADIHEGDLVLEPSAGQGAIVKAILNTGKTPVVYCFELMPINQTFLKRIEGVQLLGSDFLFAQAHNYYDRIVANPPFAKNQDIDHIYEMYNCLKEGGRLVSIASKHWQLSGNKKEIQFSEWLNDLGAEIIEIPAGEFKESGTAVATCIIVINK